MDQGLFTKHIKAIKERTSIKETIITSILERTGIALEESEITILKKTVSLSTSSVKKMALLRKNSKDVLNDLGYTLSI